MPPDQYTRVFITDLQAWDHHAAIQPVTGFHANRRSAQESKGITSIAVLLEILWPGPQRISWPFHLFMMICARVFLVTLQLVVMPMTGKWTLMRMSHLLRERVYKHRWVAEQEELPRSSQKASTIDESMWDEVRLVLVFNLSVTSC